MADWWVVSLKGFDTASSILLLSVSATASTSLREHPGELILLPLLFTAGMTAIDTRASHPFITLFFPY